MSEDSTKLVMIVGVILLAFVGYGWANSYLMSLYVDQHPLDPKAYYYGSGANNSTIEADPLGYYTPNKFNVTVLEKTMDMGMTTSKYYIVYKTDSGNVLRVEDIQTYYKVVPNTTYPAMYDKGIMVVNTED